MLARADNLGTAYCAASPDTQQQLAESVMEDVRRELDAEKRRRTHERDQRELVWARARRDAILMRHPTNWAQSLLFQVFLAAADKPKGQSRIVDLDTIACVFPAKTALVSEQ